MFHRSPILSFAIELLLYSIELQKRRSDRERKLTVLHLAQAVELTVKAALVERNISIYEKSSRTLNTHDARTKLIAEMGSLPMTARVELLIDERNAIQHRYGNVDDIALDYHLETSIVFMRAVLNEGFDIDLDDLVRSELPVSVWSSVRFIERDPTAPSAELDTPPVKTGETPIARLLRGFAAFERTLKESAERTNPGVLIRSALDVSMKFLAYVNATQELLRQLPSVFTLRNSAAHGMRALTEEDVERALSTLEQVERLLRQPEQEAELARAVEAHVRGRRGLAPAPPRETSGSGKPASLASPAEPSTSD